jgi:hypothetical protein
MSGHDWLAASLVSGSLIAAAAGCNSPRLVPVGGVVVDADGEPVAGGVIEIASEDGGSAARGRIGRDGRFTLATGGRPGVLPGRYSVVILPPADPSEARLRSHAHREPARGIDRRFARYETSGLTLEVAEGDRADTETVITLP